MTTNHHFVNHFREHVAARPAKTALVFLTEAGSGTSRRELTYAELDRQARRVAVELAALTRVGDRAMLLFTPGPEFVVGFLGCLYAGVVAVPAPMPGSNGRGIERLAVIARDARIRALVTESRVAEGVRAWAVASGLADVPLCPVDAPAEGSEERWTAPAPDPTALAFLQYTSGSTSEPKGVMVTHANLVHNEQEIGRAIGSDENLVGCGWLPQFHDMGLIGQLLHPLFTGGTAVLLSPLTFLKRPFLWLAALSEFRATSSVAPNFAFELVVRRVTDEQLAQLDLSALKVILNGSEPIEARTVETFTARMAAAGLDPAAVSPCYGLAEATLLVTGARDGRVTRTVDPRALERDTLVDADPGADAGGGAAGRVLMSSGSAGGMEVRIVDPDTTRTLPDGRVGEIWVRGGSVAAGYWNQPELSERTFRATTDGETGFLRTGDLGALADGELYVVGRLKEMLIVNGRNLYPHDIEHTARQVHPALQTGVGASFVVGERPSRLVLVHEVRAATLGDTPTADIAARIRADVRAEHDVHVAELVLIARGDMIRTTSGKVRRGEMRSRFLAGELTPLATA